MHWKALLFSKNPQTSKFLVLLKAMDKTVQVDVFSFLSQKILKLNLEDGHELYATLWLA